MANVALGWFIRYPSQMCMYSLHLKVLVQSASFASADLMDFFFPFLVSSHPYRFNMQPVIPVTEDPFLCFWCTKAWLGLPFPPDPTDEE